MVNCSTIYGVSGVTNTLPCKVRIVPSDSSSKWILVVTYKPSEEANQFTIYLYSFIRKFKFFRQVWGGVINKDRTAVFMYGGRGWFRVRYVYW